MRQSASVSKASNQTPTASACRNTQPYASFYFEILRSERDLSVCFEKRKKSSLFTVADPLKCPDDWPPSIPSLGAFDDLTEEGTTELSRIYLANGLQEAQSRWMNLDGTFEWRPCLVLSLSSDGLLLLIEWKNNGMDC